ISPWPAPTVSTTTKLRPVPTSRSRVLGSTRSGSTISSLRPVIEATFWVATTLPVTFATNMARPSCAGEQVARLPRHDDLLVGRHRPQLHPAVVGVDGRLAPGRPIALAVEPDAEPLQPGADRLAHRHRVLADPAREDDG